MACLHLRSIDLGPADRWGGSLFTSTEDSWKENDSLHDHPCFQAQRCDRKGQKQPVTFLQKTGPLEPISASSSIAHAGIKSMKPSGIATKELSSLPRRLR